MNISVAFTSCSDVPTLTFLIVSEPLSEARLILWSPCISSPILGKGGRKGSGFAVLPPSDEAGEADAWLLTSKIVASLQEIIMNRRGTADKRSAKFLITIFMEFVIIYPLRYSVSK